MQGVMAMKRFRAKSLRRMPSKTREIARLVEELASVHTRLANRIPDLTTMEMMAGASSRTTCYDRHHTGVVQAALRYLEALDDFPASDPASSILDLRAALRPYILDLGVPEYPGSPDISA